jgi:hypothetical protein
MSTDLRSCLKKSWRLCGLAAPLLAIACGPGTIAQQPADGAAPDADGFLDEAGGSDASWMQVDGGYVIPDAGIVRADRFITKVVSFTPGDCAGFGQASMPGIVMGPPIGGGASQGSTDVVSLGGGGTIVVSFEPNAIVDGPGVDLLVFENPFDIGGDDGVTWATFPCTATLYPYGACAGWHPVYSNPDNGISPVDPAVAGGDPFDLADVGVKRARYVRVVDKTHENCPAQGPRPTTNGFDLDAMGIVNAAVE